MNDPIAAGVMLSAAFLLVYAAWNAPVLRWAAICLALGMLVWAVTEAIPLAQEHSPLPHPCSVLAKQREVQRVGAGIPLRAFPLAIPEPLTRDGAASCSSSRSAALPACIPQQRAGCVNQASAGTIDARQVQEKSMLKGLSMHTSAAFEIRFQSLFHEGRALAFPCDSRGEVDLDAMGEKARNNYLFARGMIGREYAMPFVQQSATHG